MRIKVLLPAQNIKKTKGDLPMKRIIAILLCLMIVVGLTACKADEPDTGEDMEVFCTDVFLQ